MIRALDKERKRQGMTKKQLAEKCGMLDTSVRRLFSIKDPPDLKFSTVSKMVSALGGSIEFKKIDEGLNDEQRKLLFERLCRRRLAERLAMKNNLDAGDIEHALYNLTLSMKERLTRRLHRAGFVSEPR